MQENFCTIELLGASISVSTEEDIGYFRDLVKQVEDVTQEIKDSLGLHEPLSVAIMAAIFLADESVRLRNRCTGFLDKSQQFSSHTNGVSSDLQVLTEDKLAHIESVLDRTLKQC